MTTHPTGVRRILNNAADRALATRHAEAWYVATVLATAAASLKGLAVLLIQLVQLDIAQARETRRLARQVLRLSRVQTGVLSSADVGDDTA